MKIYTKKGDKGTTGLLGGTRVAKNNIRIEAYGTLDELNSHIGLLSAYCPDNSQKSVLPGIQERLFTLGAQLAAGHAKGRDRNFLISSLPVITTEDVTGLEKEIDRMNDSLPEMKSFVLPGGNIAVSQGHICRCVCRRAERLVVSVSMSETIPDMAIPYLNRLSDYLFVLCRFLAKEMGAEEVPWRPNPLRHPR